MREWNVWVGFFEDMIFKRVGLDRHCGLVCVILGEWRINLGGELRLCEDDGVLESDDGMSIVGKLPAEEESANSKEIVTQQAQQLFGIVRKDCTLNFLSIQVQKRTQA